MKGRAFLLLVIVLAGFSCRNASNKTSEFVFTESDSLPVTTTEKLSPEAISDISKNISSPIDIANLLQTLKVPFSQTYLATSVDANKQSTNFHKALKLGILGTDLGYLNMYEKTGTSLDVLASISKLSEDLKVGQFFNFELIRKLSKNKSNLDSLLFISINSYSQIDKYLRDNDRGQFSALMIIGVWLEGQYLATQVVDRYPDKKLFDRIGEQKIILNDLLMLVSPYRDRDQEFASLSNDLQNIKDKYRDVKITYTQGDPISVEKSGSLVVTQTETSMVSMSKEQLNGIIEITRDIRNKLIANN
jgi:hypothetical protein